MKYAKITKFNFILSLIFTIILLLMLRPLWLDVKTLEANSTRARIDVYTQEKGRETPNFGLFDGQNYLRSATWMPRVGRQGYNFEKKNSRIRFVIESKEDAFVVIDLRGPFVIKNPKKRSDGLLPYWVDYEKLSINNGPNILKNKISVWHDKPYIYKLPVKAGQKYDVLVKWKESSKGRALYHVDYYILIILVVLAFLFASKVVKYLAQFKTKQLKSRIDIVFLSVFFVLLFVPMAHISDAEKSDQENRMLAKYEPLWQNGKLNLKYGEKFEKWFNDHFWGRDDVIKLYSKFRYSVSDYYSNGWSGLQLYFAKDGWMFDSGETRKFKGFSPKNMDKVIQNFVKLKNFFNKKNIKFYFFISPTKGEIYSEYNIRYLAEKDKTKDVIELIGAKSGVDVYYPLDEYLDAKKTDYLFFKTDHHFTETAALIAYRHLANLIADDFADFNFDESYFNVKYDNMVVFEGLRHIGVTALRINVDVPENQRDVLYKYYLPSDGNSIRKVVQTVRVIDFYNDKAPNQLKGMLIGNSFVENFVSFLPYNVRQIRKFRTNSIGLDMEKISNEIEKFNPDFVVFAIHASWMSVLPNMFKD